MAEQKQQTPPMRGQGPTRGMTTARAKNFKQSIKRLALSLKGNYSVIIVAFAFVAYISAMAYDLSRRFAKV